MIVRYAKLSPTRPTFAAVRRKLVGAKRDGIRYENALAKALPDALHGQWFEYVDGSGEHRWCQTDFLIIGDSRVLIIECKLSWTLEGHRQINELYCPVVSRALERECWGIVCRALIYGTLDDAVARWGEQQGVCWNWLPGTPTRLRQAA
jgi:hypothetical protein